jgi:hypothetical protein
MGDEHMNHTVEPPGAREERGRNPPLAVRRFAQIGILTVAALVGCTDDSRDGVEEDVRSAASQVEREVRSVVSDVVDLTDEVARDAAELAARNLASSQGAEAFRAAGHPIDGDLSCSATIGGGLSEISIDCTGTTEDGGSAELSGSTSELPGASVVELEGMFTGTVDGEEVFSTENLGG